MRHSQSQEGFGCDECVFPPSWQGLKQQVVYLAQFGGGLQVVEGAPGAGKSTFAHWLSDNLDDLAVPIIRLPAEAGEHSVFSELLRQLGLRPPASANAGELLVMLRGYVQSLHRDGARAIALIDDAHRMADSDLAALTSIMQGESESGDGLHLILMAEPGLATRIDQLQLLDVAMHDASLPPLSPVEVEAMLMKRMGQPAAGMAEDLSRTLWNETGGLPGKVLARLNASQESKPGAAPEIESEPLDKESAVSLQGWPIAHFMALIILCCTLLWAFFAKKQEPDSAVPDERTSVPVVQERGIVEREGTSPEVERVSRSSSSIAASETGEADAIVGAAAPRPEDTAPEGEAETSLGRSTPDFPQAQLTDRGEREMDNAAVETVAIPDSGPAVQPEEELAVVVPEAEKVDAADASVAASLEADAPLAAEKPQKSAAPTVSNQQNLVAESEAKLLDFPGSAYVLQLMASSAPKELLDFLEAQPNKHNLMVYRAERNGRMLHILVEGFYADRDAARAAIANLPAKQQKGGPWPTRIGQIHQDINANRRR